MNNHPGQEGLTPNNFESQNIEPLLADGQINLDLKLDDAAMLDKLREESSKRIKRILAFGALLLVGVSSGSMVARNYSVNLSKNIDELPAPIRKNGVEQIKPSLQEDFNYIADIAAESGYINTNPNFIKEPSFVQDFATMSDGPIDTKIWNIETGNGSGGWGNNEAQYYTDDQSNVSIENGVLAIKADKELYGGHEYTSARINTRNKMAFQYGKIDIVAKLPEGVGTWPAIWLLSENDEAIGVPSSTDKKSANNYTEIDIVEAIGLEPDWIYSVMHSATSHEHGKVLVPDSSKKFNTYTVEWTPSSITFFVNGKPYYNNEKDDEEWAFDQPFYLIVNQAVGGNWAGRDKKNYPPNGIDNQSFPSSLEIESIVYYKYKEVIDRDQVITQRKFQK